jgi:hypothetical protein
MPGAKAVFCLLLLPESDMTRSLMQTCPFKEDETPESSSEEGRSA